MLLTAILGINYVALALAVLGQLGAPGGSRSRSSLAETYSLVDSLLFGLTHVAAQGARRAARAATGT